MSFLDNLVGLVFGWWKQGWTLYLAIGIIILIVFIVLQGVQNPTPGTDWLGHKIVQETAKNFTNSS